jgi:hypothetical protein
MRYIAVFLMTSICSPEDPGPSEPIELPCEKAWIACPNDSACPNGLSAVCEYDMCTGYTGKIRCEDKTGICPYDPSVCEEIIVKVD